MAVKEDGIITTIKFKRGLAATLPTTAQAGEPRYATDTKQLFVNDGTSNVLVGVENPAKNDLSNLASSLVSGNAGKVLGITPSGAISAVAVASDNAVTDVTVNGTSVVTDGVAAVVISGKQNMVSNPTADNLVLTDGNGQTIDAGVALSSLLSKSSDVVTAWQGTPDNSHVPSEKLVKDAIDAIVLPDHYKGQIDFYVDNVSNVIPWAEQFNPSFYPGPWTCFVLNDGDGNPAIVTLMPGSSGNWCPPGSEGDWENRFTKTDITGQHGGDYWYILHMTPASPSTAHPLPGTGVPYFTHPAATVTWNADNGVFDLAPDPYNSVDGVTIVKDSSGAMAVADGSIGTDKLAPSLLDDIQGKMPKIDPATAGNAVMQKADGTVEDAGFAASAVELKTSRVSSWQGTPDNAHYPTEKLVADTLDSLVVDGGVW